jgi:fatty-acyl-CoA synthase
VITGDILGERARLSPDDIGFVDVPTGERLTFGHMNARAVRCAQILAEAANVQKGDRVGILSENRLEFLDFFFAAAKAGFILVPLSTRSTARELDYVAHDAGLKVLAYSGRYRELASDLKRTAPVERWIAFDDPLDAADTCFAHAAPHETFTAARCDPEDTYCLLYTSGTTGKPKGVMLPHRMIAANAVNTVLSWQLRPDDVSPIFTPFYHAGGLSVSLTAMVAIGGRIILHDAFDASEVWQTIERERCTIAFGVPTIFKMMMEAPEFPVVDLSHVRWFISGGAPLPLYIIEVYQQRGITFKQGYGLTEVGVNCFAMSADDSRRKKGSIGRPMLFTQARLVSEEGTDVGINCVGELWLRGPHVCKGYWNNPDATAASLDSAGWFHTGDLARRDEEGFYYIAGRLKDMIISGGVNIYPVEIEAELLLHPGVRDAAVVGVPHETWGEVGIAFVVPRSENPPSSQELLDSLAERIGKIKLPREIIFVDELPRTPYGKVIKPKLREYYLQPRSHSQGV